MTRARGKQMQLGRSLAAWMSTLGLWLGGDLACAQPTPASNEAAAAAAPAPGSVEEARDLIGWEYVSVPQGQPIKPGLSCRAGGHGSVMRHGRALPGWSALTYDCDDHITLALGREWREPGTEHLRVKVLDAVALPGATLGATLYRRPGLSITGTDGTCKLDGRQNPNLVVTMRHVKREWLNWRNGLVAAWTYDLARGRIVPVPIQRVVCYQELDP